MSRKAGGHHEGENSSGTTTDPVEAVSAQQPGLNSPPHEDDLSSQVDVLDDDNSVILIDQPASNAQQDRINTDDRNTLSQSDKDHIAIISQLAYPSDSLYAFNAPLYAKAQGILMQTASIPKGPRTIATQTNDPDEALNDALVANAAYLSGEEPLNLMAYAAALETGHSTQVGIDQDETFLNDLEPYVFSAIATASDVLTHSQMLRAPDRSQFIAAQESEVRGLEEKQVFQYVQKTSLPKNARLLNAVWSYRRKRRPDGTLWKHKARLCVDGSRQIQGLDYTESFAPVVQWSTVRLVMILASMLNLESRQIDFTQAFTQADVEELSTPAIGVSN